MEKRAKYHVINIIDESTLIINYGTTHGASYGQKIKLIEYGDVIKDLDGIHLGKIEMIIDTVKIIQAQENFSICKKMVVSGALNPFSGVTGLLKNYQVTHVSKILLEEPTEFSNLIYKTDSKVALGTTAVLVKE